MARGNIGIIGMGWVGASVAISILQRGLCKRLYVADIRHKIAEGEAMDLNHGSSFFPTAETVACTIADMQACDAIVITAGRGGKPGETRLALLNENILIAQSISDQLKGYQGLLIIVSNPVDVLTYYYQKFTEMPPERVIGTGTMLDTARLREMIGRQLKVDPKSVHADVIGEHGDSEVVIWSNARIGSNPISNWQGWNAVWEEEIAAQVKRAAQEIIKRKGATNHAIGLVTATLLKWLLRGDRRIVTISTVMQGHFGLEDVALSVPMLIGEEGVDRGISMDLTTSEHQALMNSARILQHAINSVKA